MQSSYTSRYALFGAVSCLALGAATPIMAQDLPDAAASEQSQRAPGIDISGIGGAETAVEELPDIVVRQGFLTNAPPPTGILDPNIITGVGQMISWNGDGTVGTCTGTLINPRTVIFAAHCVNTRTASAYGSQTGGVPIGFGFRNYNLPSILAWRDGGFTTQEAAAFYNAENIWYDTRSLVGGFLQADVAMATLDRPAFDIPTWAMLFTPLDGQEHVTMAGYGNTGVGTQGSVVSGGWRRRAAENYVSFLGSLADRNAWLFGSTAGTLPQNLYMVAFNDPNPAYNAATGKYDFGIFGADDVALPVEGLTGPGDSGGPLIVDQAFDRDVVIGVLSGGSRFFGPQPFGSYGTHSFYQPLYAFWDVIVANNPYAYVTNKAGDGEWTDAAHWVQTMDPNYMIEVDGALVNGVPDTAGVGIGGTGPKFGDICFLDECYTPTSTPQVGDGTPYFVQGGPGTENFVPDNITAVPAQGIRPRYYDVTLSANGTTRLSDADISIDRLTIDGQTKLDIASTGSLWTWGDFTQIRGWTNVDGVLDVNEAFLLSGFLTGTGTLRAPWVTTAAVTVAPGGADRIGTLTIDGNMIMASGSALFIDANRDGADRLAVTGMLSLSDPNAPTIPGASVVFNFTGKAPRHGQTFTIASAAGGVEGTFGHVASFQGVLRPYLTYDANNVTAELRAGALVEIIDASNITANAFAAALDRLRQGSYDSLYNLYGTIDVMDGASLTQMLSGLAPSITAQRSSLEQRQSAALADAVGDRLSLAGSAPRGSFTIVGAPGAAAAYMGGSSRGSSQPLGIAGLASGKTMAMALPETVSGFMAGGVIGSANGDSRASEGQFASWFGMGMETEVAEDTAVGLSFGYSNGMSRLAEGTAQTTVTRVSVYGSKALGGGAYVGLVSSREASESRMERDGFDGLSSYRLQGTAQSSRLSAVAEAGVNLGVAQGLTLTPRAQVGYSRLSIGNFRENGGETALRFDRLTTEQVEARLGFKSGGAHSLAGGWTIVPDFKADYVRVLDTGANSMMVRFAAADQLAFAIPVASMDSSWGEVRGGVRMEKDGLSFAAGLQAEIGRDDLTDNRGMVEMGVKF